MRFVNSIGCTALVIGLTCWTPPIPSTATGAESEYQAPQRPLRVDPPHISKDKTVKYDYDIVYVRAPRTIKGADGKERQAMVWPNAAEPENMHAPTDLMLLHPDGSEEALVEGGKGAIADLYVSFDAQWVYYTYFHDVSGQASGADVYKVNVKTRKTVRLTQQEWTPNTGAAPASAWPGDRGSGTRAVYNMHPCPLPGGRLAFVSNRDGFKAPRLAGAALQLFVMDDNGANVEKIGHLNVAQALHPVILKDGRIIFSSLESQGKHNTGWGILGIHPDGTGWNPVISALSLGGAPIPFHFQTQLSDENIIVENYYVPAMGGFGVYFKQPAQPPEGVPPFLPARYKDDPKMTMIHRPFTMPFQPYGMEVLTRFTHNHDSPGLREDPKDSKSRHTGWVTHPCGAPDNHLLTVWSGMMPANQGRIIDNYKNESVNSGIYLIKDGKPFWEPGEMLLIKNDPKYNEQWPRPLVTYKRIYGVDEPQNLASLKNDGTLSKHLPEGTPFALVGTSSLYKRESYPLGEVPKGKVTAVGQPYSAFPTPEHRVNWDGQGGDAGLYSNSDIHAIRILAMEPPSLPVVGKFSSIPGERLRILGEFPVRKFEIRNSKSESKNGQPLDPDGNPDTSFLAKIPANVAWTFQTLDKDGIMLNMAQTWHQLRPGEIRNNCGGCHAHSQQPTHFKDTFAARPDYEIFDLTKSTPLVTTRKSDESGKQWDVKNETGLRFAKGVVNVEYHRDIRPIFERSCVACHNSASDKPAGNLVLNEDKISKDSRSPGTYNTLIHHRDRKTIPYVWPSQSRNSLLTWKIFGRRTDGFPEKMVAGAEGDHQGLLNRGGQPYSPFKGSIMPPPEAVASGKVAPLTDEDRRTLLRWIDLGCPIDHDYDPKHPENRGKGWMLDDQRPTLALTYPKAGVNEPLKRILVGMYDYDTGLDMDSFQVTADFAVDGTAARQNLAAKFKSKSEGVWELTLEKPIASLPSGKLMVSIKDRQGNISHIERTFSVGAPQATSKADDKEKTFPKGSEKAVAAIRDSFPKGVIDDVAEPKGFGGSGGKGTPMFWVVRFHVGEKKHELSVLPDGIIFRLPIDIDVKDLPQAVADGIAKAAPGATIRGAEKNEVRATMKYVALDKAIPQQYSIDVVKDDKRSRVTMTGTGGNAKVTELKEAKKDGKQPDKKEIDIPEKAARSVKAIKALYPDAIVEQITTEVFDDGTGTIEILTYEIEFISKGAKHEMVASPEGVIPHLWAPVEAKDLPKAVKEALDKAVPGAKVEKARAFEIRASLRFAALEKPKTFYTLRTEKDSKTETIKLKPDGALVKKVEFPKK